MYATEATWKLLGFQTVDRNPAVTKIHARFEGEQYVFCFQLPQHKLNACKITTRTHSPLMDYFLRPSHECLDNFIITDYYEQYTVTPPKQDAFPLIVAPPGKYLDSYYNMVSKRRNNPIHVYRIVLL